MSVDRYIEAISNIDDTDALSARLIDEFDRFGVTALVVQPLPYGGGGGSSPWKPIVSSFPLKAKTAYQKFHDSADPFLEASLSFGGPVHYQRLRASMTISDAQHELFREFAKAGLMDGVAMPVISKPGVGAYCAVAFPEARRVIPRAELRKYHVIFSEYYLRYREISRLKTAVLSERERQILAGIIRGRSNAAMSEELALSMSSIDTYVRRCFEKLNVHSRTEAALKYFSLGGELRH